MPNMALDTYRGDEIPLGAIKNGINPAELIALLPLDRPELIPLSISMIERYAKGA